MSAGSNEHADIFSWGGRTQTSSPLIYLFYAQKVQRGAKMNQKIQNADKTKDDYPTSERECVINGKRFIVTRHFKGDKPLREVMTELAIKRANREMGL